MTEPFIISRDFDAPIDLLYKVQSEALHIAQWMGPEDFRFIGGHSLTPGATNHYQQAAPDGTLMYGLQRILEVVPGKKIVLLQSFADKDGNIAAHPMAPTWPRVMYSTTEFTDLGNGKSRSTTTWVPHEAGEVELATFDSARAGMTGGFDMTFDKVAAHLAKLQG